ncbi:MAG: c-type cytochrome [Rhodospirillaceae bacterium]|nr:c-type cytochrome [Rhodospirillaceae bacterium]
MGTGVFAAVASLTLGCVLAAGTAGAQHATDYDIEDGARVYEQTCAYCHGPDGDLIPGMDLGRGLYRRPLTDAEIADIIINGIPDTAMPPTPRVNEQQAYRIVAYLRSLEASPDIAAANGDAGRGKLVFEGKGTCMDCHRVHGQGSRIGPDLSGIGLLRRAAQLEQSLLEPAAEVQPANRFYSVTPADGEPVTGRLLNHDTFTVQLFDTEERLRSFVKVDLLDHGFIDTPMPSFRDELSTQEIADVVAWLVSLRGIPQ